MNKNFKIIQINGLSGFLLLIFAITGLVFGFAIFPIWVVMNVWNSIIPEILKGPAINYFQSALLWLAVNLMLYLIFKRYFSIEIQTGNEENIRDIVNEIEDESKQENTQEK